MLRVPAWLWALVCAVTVFCVACSGSPSASLEPSSDAGENDASEPLDASAPDVAAPPVDSGSDVTAPDAGPADAGPSDTGADTGTASDTGAFDAASDDAGDASDAALAPAVLTISDGPTFDYGGVLIGTSADHTFTVTNAGATGATALAASALSAPFSFKGGTYPGTGGTCDATLAASAACTIVVTFTTATATLTPGTLTLGYFDGAATQSATRAIQGTGLAIAAVTISDGPTFDYGAVADGAIGSHTFTITNSGGDAATSLVPFALAAPFQFAGGTYPGIAGTCGASLAAAASCTVVVTFAPTATGLVTGSLELSYSDGVGPATTTVALQGTGLLPAIVTISDGPTFNYGDTVVATPNSHTFTVTNIGGAVASALAAGTLSAPFSFSGGTYPGAGGTCAASLAPSTSCTVVVTFTPAALGTASGTLALGYNDGAAAKSATCGLQGNGIAPGLVTISDGATFDYGGVVLGTSLDHVFTLTNTGAVTVTAFAPGTLSAPFAFKGGSYPGTGGSCGASLASTATCTIVVTFAPTAVGLATGTISVGYDNGSGSQNTTRAIQGTGLAPALLAISDGPTFNYTGVVDGTTSDHAFTVSNTGGATATAIVPTALALPFSFKGGAYPGTGGTCGAALLGSATCAVVITFAPTAAGLATSALQLAYVDGAQNQSVSRSIQGTGLAPAVLTLSDGPTFDYGTLVEGTSANHTFTLSDTGGANATALSATALSPPFSFPGGAYPGTGGTCGASLAAGATCTIVVGFAPTSPGLVTGALGLAYFDGVANQNASRAVQGTGVGPAVLNLSGGTTFNYGNDVDGTTNDHTFSLINAGSSTATALSATALSAPFSFKGGTYPGTGGSCSVSLPGGNSTCTIVVTFSPTSPGLATSALTVGYFDGASNQSVSRPLQGTGVAPAVLALSDGPSFNYGTDVDGTSNDHTFTVTNTGSATATALTPTTLSAPYSFKGGTYPGTGGTCGASLAGSNATCTIVVTFSPTTPGLTTSALALTYSNGASNQNVSRTLQGTGMAPAVLTLSDGPSFNYGNDVDGTTNDHTFTVTNTGSATATSLVPTALVAPYSFKGGSYPGTAGTCGASLAGSNTTCAIVVTFAPTAPGLATSALAIAYADGANNQNVSRTIQGTGVAPAVLAISDGPLFDYGTTADGTINDHTFTVSNTGSASATSLVATALAAPYSFKGGTYPGAGGNCTATLAGSAACTIVVTFAPTAPGFTTTSLALAYFDGANNQNVSRSIQGTGETPAVVAISDGPLFNYGSDADGTSNDHTFTVTNSGQASATAIVPTALSAPYSFKGGSYPGTGGNCAASLAGSPATCTIVVTYAPTAPGLTTSAVALAYFDGANNQNVSRTIQGTGVAPAVIAISNAPLFDYGSAIDGSTNDHTFTLTNSGSFAATSLSPTALAAPFSFKGGAYPGTGGSCGASLAGSNATCTMVVTFAPSGTGLATSALQISYFDGANAQNAQRSIQGTGVGAAVLSFVEGTSFGFGTLGVGQTGEHVLHVTNSGPTTATSVAPLTLLAPFAFKGGSYPGFGGTCGASLVGGVTCTILVDYVAVSGAASETLTLGYDDGAQSRSTTIGLTGTGTNAAALQFTDYPPSYYAAYGLPSDPATYDYGARGEGTSTDATFYVTNDGAAIATAIAPTALAAPFSFKGGTFPGVGGGCGTTLASATTCTVVVTFAPTSATTPNLVTVSLGYNDGTSAQTANHPISGEVTTGAVLVVQDYQGANLGPAYDFGQQGVGTTGTHSFNVTNQGAATATAMSAGTASPPFGFAGGTYPGTGGTCGASLAVGASCVIVGAFTPATIGAASGTLSVAYNDGTSAQTATRPVVGTGITAAYLTIQDNQTPSVAYAFGTLPANTSADATFTVLNQGAVSASSLSGAALSAPFSFKGGTYPGTGGTCGTSLSRAASCTVVVTFQPTLNAASTATVSIAYNDGTTGETAQRALTGAGTTQAVLQVTDYTSGDDGGGGQYQPFDFGTSGIPVDHTFYVTNVGAQSATSMTGAAQTTPTFQIKGTTFPGTGGTCGTSLAAGASCTVVVTFTPGASATNLGTLSVGYNDGSTTQTATRALAGEVSLTALLVVVDDEGETQANGNPYDFGTTGTPIYHTFYVVNDGEQSATSISDGATLANGFVFTGGTYPGVGGTCGTSLATGASCSISVTFTPSGASTSSSVITLDYFDGITNQSATRAVTGTGTTQALLQINSAEGGTGTPYDFGTWGVATSQTFNVFNMGAQAATAMGDGHNLGAGFGFTGGTYPGTGGTCGATLASSAQCLIAVTFTPSGSGTSSSTIGVAYFDGAASEDATFGVTGTGTALAVVSIGSYPGAIGANQPAYDYGTTGEPLDATFYVTNSGAQTATSLGDGGSLGSGFGYKGGRYPGAGGTCGGSLASGASCQLVVTFTPSGTGVESSTITLGYNNGAGGQHATQAVTGTATNAAVLVISTYEGSIGSGGVPFDFGTWGVSTSHTFYVTNDGAQAATAIGDAGQLSDGFAFTGGSYPGTGGTCGSSLAVGTSCTVVVTFTPSGSGPAASTLGLSYDDGTQTEDAQQSVTATSISNALVQIFDYSGQQGASSSPYDFGVVGTPTATTFYVTNTGAKSATVLTAQGTLGAGFGYQGGAYPGGSSGSTPAGTCGATLASGASCTIVVTFTPSGNGAASSTITLGYNDGSSAQTATRALTATSTTAAVLEFEGELGGAPNALDFGTVGVPVSQTMTLVNVGAQAATSMSDGGTLSGMFSFTGGTYPGTGGTCGASLAVGATCTVTITFNPTGNGPASSAVTIGYANGVSTQSAVRPVTGTATTSALLVIGGSSAQTEPSQQAFDIGTWGFKTTQTLYLINMGGAAATSVVDGATLGSGFDYAGGGSYPGTAGTCTGTIASGASCTIVLSFDPSGESGVVSATLTVDYNNGTVSTYASNALTATATNRAYLVVSELSGSPGCGDACGPFQFGSVAVTGTLTHTFTIYNDGAVSTTTLGDGGGLGAPFAYEGSGGFPGTTGTCGSVLAAGATCTVVVTFEPVATGTFTSDLTLTYGDGLGGSLLAGRELAGTGQ